MAEREEEDGEEFERMHRCVNIVSRRSEREKNLAGASEDVDASEKQIYATSCRAEGHHLRNSIAGTELCSRNIRRLHHDAYDSNASSS